MRAFALAIILVSQVVTTTSVTADPPTAQALLATVEDTVRAEVLEQTLRVQRGVRDVFAIAEDRLVAIAFMLDETPGVRVPDVSVLRVEPVANTSTSGFGWRNDPIRNHRKFHNGADIKGTHGTPVVSAGDGVVLFAGSKDGYGNVVFVDHGGGVVTRYAHLRRVEIKKDATVVAGQRIGQVGSTGRTTGPHLHFEVRLNEQPVDPITALDVGALQRVSPNAGRLAAFALVPELQSKKLSETDPPKKKKTEQRPERRGRAKREKPLS
jgi:murein DD-endopeptidase MepM/ murein hydrolase activator NlpD